jgi:hypothetical protein
MVLPGVGTALGGKLGSMASKLFEVELEGMELEQQEFEVARRYVRLAASAAQKAATAPPNAPPRVVVRKALTSAARQHAPGLVRRIPQASGARPSYGYSGGNGYASGASTGGGSYRRPRSGQWVRRGRKIIVLGV